MTKYHI